MRPEEGEQGQIHCIVFFRLYEKNYDSIAAVNNFFGIFQANNIFVPLSPGKKIIFK